MSMRESIASIAESLRKIAFAVVLSSSLLSAFLVYVMIEHCFEIKNNNREYPVKIEVVVARTNLVAGTILTRDNIGSKRQREDHVGNDYVDPVDGRVLIGHRILKDVAYGEPITWHNTDIVITNTILQPGDTPNPHSPSAQGAGGR